MTEKTGFLFIGGPMDGQRRAVERLVPVIRYRQSPALYTPLREFNLNTMVITEHYYVLRRMTCGTLLYAHDSIPEMEIVRHLVSGYRTNSL